MAFDTKIMAEVARERLTRTVRAEADTAARRRDILEKLPAAAELYISMREAGISIARDALKGVKYSPDTVRDLEDEYRERLRRVLLDAGYPSDALDMRYHCPLCKDDGYVAGGNPCVCLIDDYKRAQLGELSKVIDVKHHTFEHFSLSIFSDKTDNAWGMSPRENMSAVRDMCFEMCARFESSRNLLLVGPPGTGKTYLATCVAAELSGRGHSILYYTAADAFAAYERRKFTYDDDGSAAAEIDRLVACDLLILDDLGAEFKTQFVDTAFHMLLQSRLGKGKRMLICTALEEDKGGKAGAGLYTRYSPQITSRLAGDFLALPLFGGDLRRA